jgi:uncharacterized membrane protein
MKGTIDNMLWIIIAVVGVALTVAIIFLVSSGFLPGLISGMEGGLQKIPGLG